MNVKDRIFEYLKYKGVSITKAESLLCWSKGALLKSNSISSDRLGEFYLRFSDVSPEWLLTGKGEMLLMSEGIKDNLNEEDLAKRVASIPIDPDMVNFYEDIIKRKDEEILKLQGEVYRLMMEIKKVSKGA